MNTLEFLGLLRDFELLYPNDEALDVLPALPWRRNCQKNDEKAKRCRIFANMSFRRGELPLAFLYYNASLCYALPGSSEIPLVYGNRATIYHKICKYGVSIENIRLARENGYPDDSLAQLIARVRNYRSFSAKEFFQLSHPPNEKIPFIAGCLKLCRSQKYGRYIMTNKDLKAGDIIAIEPAAFGWPNSEAFNRCCLFCTKTKTGSLIPCSHCTKVMFCSEECRKKAAPLHLNDKLYGAYCCEFLERSLKLQLEAYRIAGGVDEALELLKGAKSKTIFDFDFSDPDDPDYEKNTLIALNGLWRRTDMDCGTEYNRDKLLNIPPINVKPRSAAERKKLLQFIMSQSQICDTNLTRSSAGHDGIFLFQSLLNHSCSPNIHCLGFDDKMVSYVCRPIKSGQQLFISYGVDAENDLRNERQMTMKRIFQFKCECEACITKWPRKFPKKDSSFVKAVNWNRRVDEPEEAIEQFKNNCKYIDENAWKMACYEVAKLMERNNFLLNYIAASDISELK